MSSFDKRPDRRPPKTFRKSGPHRGQARTPESAPADDSLVRLFGIHAVEAALANRKRKIVRIEATENAERRLAEAITASGLSVKRVSPRDLDRRLGEDTVHQGIMAECEPLPEPELADLAEKAVDAGPLILLDHVTDPHNVGAILRSAAVFGAAGVIMTRRHSPPLNGTLAKSASGALEMVPVALVQNLAKAMEELKAQGVRLIGLDGTAQFALEAEQFDGPVAIVLGAEGKGLRQLTGDTCDLLARISTAGTLASLNVSNAAAIALHTAMIGRGKISRAELNSGRSGN